MRRVLLILLVLAVPVAMIAQQAEPPKPSNLQVLPADIPREQLIEIMKSFTKALGVRCVHCHVGEEGQPLSSFDFASDAKEPKKIARAMMLMTRSINGEYVSKVRDGQAKVTCATCHRGARTPEGTRAVVTDQEKP